MLAEIFIFSTSPWILKRFLQHYLANAELVTFCPQLAPTQAPPSQLMATPSTQTKSLGIHLDSALCVSPRSRCKQGLWVLPPHAIESCSPPPPLPHPTSPAPAPWAEPPSPAPRGHPSLLACLSAPTCPPIIPPRAAARGIFQKHTLNRVTPSCLTSIGFPVHLNKVQSSHYIPGNSRPLSRLQLHLSACAPPTPTAPPRPTQAHSHLKAFA